MAVYFSKKRGAWFIRASFKGKEFYCYRSPSGVFFRKADALAYEPSFVAGLVDAPAASGLCESYFDAFFASLKGTAKDSTVYGFVKEFGKYVDPVFRGVRVDGLDDSFLDFANKRMNAAFKGRDPQRLFSVSRKWVVFLSRQGLRLDGDRLYSFSKKARGGHVYHVWDLPTFKAFLSFEKDPSWILFFSLLYYYGLRVGEALALQWGDFTKKGLSVSKTVSVKNLDKSFKVTKPKTSCSVAVLPVVKAVYGLVPKGLDPSSWCFLGRGGRQPIGQTTVVSRIKLDSRKAGLKALTPHEFRHSCASYLIGKGLPLRIVSKWMRHSSEIVTATVYAHLFPGELDDVGQFWDEKCGKTVVKKIKKT